MRAARRQGGGGEAAGARPPSLINGLDLSPEGVDELGVGLEWDLEEAAKIGGMNRVMVERAFDSLSLKNGRDWIEDRGALLCTWEALCGVMGALGHVFPPDSLAAAKKGRHEAGRRKGWHRLRVASPANAGRVLLCTMIGTGEGVRCMVPDASRFVMGMHLTARPGAMASDPTLFEIGEDPPRARGRW